MRARLQSWLVRRLARQRATTASCWLQRTTANAVEPCVSHACVLPGKCKAPGLLFASVLPALVLDRVAARTTPRGRDSTPQNRGARRPVAPKTAGRESSLSAININWPPSHGDRDTRRQSDQDASRRRLLAPVTRGPGRNRQPPAAKHGRHPRPARPPPGPASTTPESF